MLQDERKQLEHRLFKEDAFIDPMDAMGLARLFVVTHDEVYVRHNSFWYRWEGARYRASEQERLGGALWKWLEGLGNITPTPAIVKNTLKALTAIRQTPVGLEMPGWLRQGVFPAPESVIAFSNGLLSVSRAQPPPQQRGMPAPLSPSSRGVHN